MPEYLAPGVFVEETSYRSKSIEGVSTSVAALAGPTRFGPVRGRPEVLTSYADYERMFGDDGKLSFLGQDYLNYSALAARAFFDNGGKQLYVSRIVHEGTVATAGADSGSGLAFSARFPGAGGNLDLAVLWEDSQNLLSQAVYMNKDDLPEGETCLLTVVGTDSTPVSSTYFTSSSLAGDFRWVQVLVKRSGNNINVVSGSKAWVLATGDGASPDNIAAGDVGSKAKIADLDTAGLSYKFTRVTLGDPASGELTDASGGEPAVLVLSKPLSFTGAASPDKIANDRVVFGTVKRDSDKFTVLADWNGFSSGNFDLELSALAAAPDVSANLSVCRRFSIDVIRRRITVDNPTGNPGEGEVVYRFGGLSLDESSPSFVNTLMPEKPEHRMVALTAPVYSDADSGKSVTALFKELLTLCGADTATAKLLRPAKDSFSDARYIVTLKGGSDGALPAAGDYAGEADEVSGSTGMTALEQIEDISIVMTPFAAADANTHQAVVAELQKHCARMRYRVGLVDSREDMAISEVRKLRSQFDDSRLALYHPWVVSADPTGLKATIDLPPSGFMAGIYARTDVDRGVHKAPANTPVFGALRFNQDINKFQQELLNPAGINCLRSFPGRGHRVWGGRTMSSDPEWKYVNVRRYFLYLERSIDRGTQWAVFEPNGELLWANVRHTIEGFLFNEWKNGRLLGTSQKSAFFVRCDRSTMTQADIDNGRLVCEVGVAPLRPAEFVVFRIGQKTADA